MQSQSQQIENHLVAKVNKGKINPQNPYQALVGKHYASDLCERSDTDSDVQGGPNINVPLDKLQFLHNNDDFSTKLWGFIAK